MDLFIIENKGLNAYSYRKETAKTREEAKSIIMYHLAFNNKYVCFTYTEADTKTMIKNLTGN